ncbi:MAG: hypothetical protein J2P36_22850 [Ktedonobacteraceae bacterium]|nr:hypothetical protein [Ktedonobacteraceae bacterium]
MDKDFIDISVNLAFSLELFQRRKVSGVLQATLPRVAGLPRNSVASLHVAEGIVIACQIEDQQGSRMLISAKELIRLDAEHGPFEWMLRRSQSSSPTQASPASQPPLSPPPHSNMSHPLFVLDTAVPKVVAPLEWGRLQQWTYQQRQLLYQVWRLIDGNRSVWEIKLALGQSIPAETAGEVLRVLIALQVIRITS